MITKTLAMGYRLKKIPSRMLYKCKGKKKKTNTNMYKLAASKKKIPFLSFYSSQTQITADVIYIFVSDLNFTSCIQDIQWSEKIQNLDH